MNTLREAAQAALEALYATEIFAGHKKYPASRIAGTITALRAALEQEEEGCSGCGKKASDGWALYCVECVEGKIKPALKAGDWKALVCGVDCHPGDKYCNGYCTGKADAPPAPTEEQKRAALAQQEQEYTTGHCKEKAKPGGCQLHNLHCGYPDCDRKPAALAQQDAAAELTRHSQRMGMYDAIADNYTHPPRREPQEDKP